MKLNNLSQGENISSIVSTKAGKCISIEAILFDECVDRPAKLDQVGDVEHGEQETDSHSSVMICKNCNNLCSGNRIPGITLLILGIPLVFVVYTIPNPRL